MRYDVILAGSSRALALVWRALSNYRAHLERVWREIFYIISVLRYVFSAATLRFDRLASPPRARAAIQRNHAFAGQGGVAGPYLRV